MNRSGPARPPTWLLFVLPLAMAAAIIFGILLGGPLAGFAAALVVSLAIVVVAVRLTSETPERESDGTWRRAAALRFTVPAILAVGGVALILSTSGTARIIGWGLAAVALTIAISLVFLELGYSEDRARARESRRRGRQVRADAR